MPDTFKPFVEIIGNFVEIIEKLIGKEKGKTLCFILLVGVVAYIYGQNDSSAQELISIGLFICIGSGIIVTALGLIEHQTAEGLPFQKGLLVGLTAGFLAALSGGAAYYGFNFAECCNPSWLLKFVRLFGGSIIIGAILGGVMGLLRLVWSRAPRTQETGQNSKIIAWIIGIFAIFAACIVLLVIFNNISKSLQSETNPQGLMLFWQVSLVAFSFAIIYVFIMIRLYGRKDDSKSRDKRWKMATSSALVAFACALLAFLIVHWTFGNSTLEYDRGDPQCRVQSSSEYGICHACDVSPDQSVIKYNCKNDMRDHDSAEVLTLKVIFVLVMTFAIFMFSAHPKNPVLHAIDRKLWRL